jgi:hypothetical protein
MTDRSVNNIYHPCRMSSEKIGENSMNISVRLFVSTQIIFYLRYLLRF